jgi:hypothetical protein
MDNLGFRVLNVKVYNIERKEDEEIYVKDGIEYTLTEKV